MDALKVNQVPLDDSYATSSSDDSDSIDTQGPGAPKLASSTGDPRLFNPANSTAAPTTTTAPGYANPAPDLVGKLYEAGKLKQSEKAQKKARKLAESIPKGTLDHLFAYAESNDVEGMKKLIETGSINLHIPRVTDMRTPLMLAVIKGHVDMVRLLIAHAKPEQLKHQDGSGAYTLDLALDHSTVIIAGMVYNAAPDIKYDIEIENKKYNGLTPLAAAIVSRKETRIRRLLKFLPNVNERSLDGSTALEKAIEKGMLKFARKLLDKGAFVNEKDVTRDDPLSLATRWGFDDIVILLCNRGAAVDRQNKDGNTPLQLAAWGGYQLALQRLLDHRANPDLQDNAGATPLYAAASQGHANIIRRLVAAQARVDLADLEDHTPLHMAALAGHASAVEALIKAGANVDAVDKYGRTPLQYAVEKGHSDCARLLLENKADVNHADLDGHTALDIHDGAEDVGDLLREYGARGRCCKPCVIV